MFPCFHYGCAEYLPPPDRNKSELICLHECAAWPLLQLVLFHTLTVLLLVATSARKEKPYSDAFEAGRYP